MPLARMIHVREIDFHHDGIHHEEQRNGDRDGDHGRVIHMNGDAVQRLGDAGSDFPEDDAARDA